MVPPNFHKALGLHRKLGPITSFHVFDFDGTLVHTPGPDEGKAKFLASTGKPWSGGWWGRPGSLTPPVVDSPFPASRVITPVFNELEQVITRSQTSVGIVVTGRLKTLRQPLLRILDEICISSHNDTVPEGHSFLPHSAVMTHPGGSMNTIEFKTQLFKDLLTSAPLVDCPIKHLHLWEDRKEHAQVFASTFADELRTLTGIETVVHFVPDLIS